MTEKAVINLQNTLIKAFRFLSGKINKDSSPKVPAARDYPEIKYINPHRCSFVYDRPLPRFLATAKGRSTLRPLILSSTSAKFELSPSHYCLVIEYN